MAEKMTPKQRVLRMTKEQRAWCKRYTDETTFEPMMDDFFEGNKTFVQAATNSNRWFEDWSNDAHLNITRDIPGEDEELADADRRPKGKR